MEDGHTVLCCEECHQANETVDIRPSDMLCQPCYLDKDTCSIDGEKQQISEQELETEQTTITQSPSITAKTHPQDVSHFESMPEAQGCIEEIGSKGNSQNGSVFSESKNECPKCNKHVLKGGLSCAVCNIWLHFKCAGITKEKFPEVNLLTCKNCMETCKKCCEHPVYKCRMKKEIDSLKKNFSELEKTPEHLNQELTSVHNQYEEKDRLPTGKKTKN